MNKTKKILMIVSLSTLAAACLMLILAVFKVPVFTGVPLRLLLILSTTAVASGIAINELSVIKRNKVLGFMGIGLLGLSVLMAYIIFCSNLLETYSVFNTITGIVSVLSVATITIISLQSKLGKRVLGLQIPTYAVIAALAIIICLIIGGVDVFAAAGMFEVIIILAICCIGLFIASSVVSSKIQDTELPEQKHAATYSELAKENAELKAEIERLKTEIAQLKK